MKFRSIHLQNLLSHQDTTLTLDVLTVLRGENGAGKSTVEQAFQMLLTGRSSSTKDNGSGSRDLIRSGTDKSAITIEVEDAALLGKRIAKVRCSLTEKSGRTVVIKDPADESWTGSDFLSTLAGKREVLDCLINSRYFVDMDDARQKAFLAAIILPASVIWDDWVEKAVNDCELRVDWSLKAFDVIAFGYDQAYEERKNVNRKIKEWREPQPVAPAEMDQATIRTRLAERQTQRTQLAIDRDKVLGKWQRGKDSREKASGKISSLESKLTIENQRRDVAAKDQLSKAQFKEAEKLAAGAEKGAKLEAEIQQNAGALAEIRRTLSRLNDVGEKGECPTCTQPVTDAEFEHIVAPFIQKQDFLLTAERDMQTARKELGDYAGAQKLLDAHAQAEKDLKLIGEHIADVEKDIRELKNEIAGQSEESQPDTFVIDQQIDDIDSRIEKGNAALTAAVQAESARRQYDEAMATRKKLDAKQALLERLVEYFGPKGIQAKLLDEHVGGFQGSMNKFLAGWGMKCQLAFEPFSFRMGPLNNREAFILRTESEGQNAMFAAAFQVALAKVTGFNFVFVDAAEVLSPENRVTLFKNLMSSGLEQVIVALADTRREVPKVPNSAFYLLALDKAVDVPTTTVERLIYANCTERKTS